MFQVDLRSQLPPPRDQGPRNTCLAFAVTGAHELERNHSSSLTLHLSEEAIYWAARQLCTGTSGLTFVSAGQALSSQGQPEETVWPYDQLCDESIGYAPPPGVLLDSNCFLAELKRIDLSIDAVREILDQHRLVVLGIQMSASFFGDNGGIIQMPTAGEIIQAGHAVGVVGYSDLEEYLLFRNSWGEEWGDEGYGYLPYAYLGEHGLAAYSVIAA